MTKNLPLIFCAIDNPDLKQTAAIVKVVSEAGCGVKLGLEFFNANGPQGIAAIRDANPDMALFLDLKCHDIPNTVAGAIRSVAPLAPDYMTIHAGGGMEMMKAAQDAAGTIKLLAVTVLTSLDDAGLNDVGQRTPAASQVLNLAKLTHTCGLPGIICAGPDVVTVRKDLAKPFVLMVPGIRPAGSAVGDQKRVMTPKEAVDAGATHLVIGRPITGAADPGQAAADILTSLS